MIKHVLDYYMDGHISTPFCKVCSAEGYRLLDPCSKETRSPNLPDNKQKILDDERDYLDSNYDFN